MISWIFLWLNLSVAALAAAPPCPEGFAALTASRPVSTAALLPDDAFGLSAARGTDLSFLPESLQQRTRSAPASLEKEVATDKGLFTHSQDLKNLVDALTLERKARVKAMTELRIERRLLKDKILGATDAYSAGMFRRQKAALDQKLIQLGAEVGALNRNIYPLRNRMGLGVLHAAASADATATDTLILLRANQPQSAGQLMHNGFGKPLNSKFNSAQDGVIAGLLPYDQSLSAKVAAKGPEAIAAKQALVEEALKNGEVVKFEYRIGNLVAVKRNGKTFFVDEFADNVKPDEIVYILGTKDMDGEVRALVSDVDPLAFGFRDNRPVQVARDRGAMGMVTDDEVAVIRGFDQKVGEILGRPEKGPRYMHHGAENRYLDSPGVSGYPITAFFPGGESRVIPIGPSGDPDKFLKAFFQEARDRGFSLEANPRWGWK